MKQNGLSTGGAMSRLMTLERLIKEREDEILNEHLLSDVEVSDEEGDDGIEPAADDKMNAEKPSEKRTDDDFATDSSDDNASVVSEDSGSGDLNSSSVEKANELKSQGDNHVHSGEWKEAIRCYSEALKHSEMAALYGNRSLCYMKTDEFDKAERDCSCAIELDPTYKRIFRRRAAIRLRRRDYYGSAKDLQDLRILSASSAVDPNIQEEYRIILPLARYIAVHGNCSNDEKFKELEAAVLAKLCEKEESAAKSFMSRKNWALAAESLSMAIMVSPSTPRLYSDRALANFKLGKTNMAEKDCTEAIGLDPSNPQYFSLRAEIRKKLGDLKGSEADEKTAKTLPPVANTKAVLRPVKTDVRRGGLASKADPPAATRPQPQAAPEETPVFVRVLVQDVYSSSIDELYDLSKLPDKIKSLFGSS
uniref:RNA polymerase II-associated protein 3 n=5 Tax=Lygus hesperus TaxID=30085 RepID=A0A0K8S4H6_LYGHE